MERYCTYNSYITRKYVNPCYLLVWSQHCDLILIFDQAQDIDRNESITAEGAEFRTCNLGIRRSPISFPTVVGRTISALCIVDSRAMALIGVMGCLNTRA